MNEYYRYLSLLRSVAETVDSHRSRHAAAIIYRHRIVSLGTNHMKTHPFQTKYQRRPDSIYLHAEVSAIKRATHYLSERELTRSVLISVRVKYDNALNPQWGMSKPCEGCQRAIAEFGIRSVWYSTDLQELVSL